MSITTIVKTTSICDVCGATGETDHHGLPDRWGEIVIAKKSHFPNSKAGVDWRSRWDGVCCEKCFSGGDSYPDISREAIAVPLLKKIWAKMRGKT